VTKYDSCPCLNAAITRSPELSCFHPTRVPISGKIVKIAHNVHTAAITMTGRIFVWGNNHTGQCGLPIAIKRQLTPTTPDALLGLHIVDVAAAPGLTVVVDLHGRVFTSGDDRSSQLGRLRGPSEHEIDETEGCGNHPQTGMCDHEFRRVDSLPPVWTVAAGGCHALALTEDQHVFSWGANAVPAKCWAGHPAVETNHSTLGRGPGRSGCLPARAQIDTKFLAESSSSLSFSSTSSSFDATTQSCDTSKVRNAEDRDGDSDATQKCVSDDDDSDLYD